VVIKLWDWRRMVVPLSYFIEKPFQNWTRETSALIGSVFLYVDYTVPVEKVREKLMEVARASPLWDGRVVVLQVSDAKDHTIELRALLSARSAPAAWDLRCDVREKLIAYLQAEYPKASREPGRSLSHADSAITANDRHPRWCPITIPCHADTV
jgi:small-conductance mechanosensitive channel